MNVQAVAIEDYTFFRERESPAESSFKHYLLIEFPTGAAWMKSFDGSLRRLTARYAVNESSCLHGNQGGIADTIDESIGSSLCFRDELFLCLKTNQTKIFIEKEHMQ